MTLRRRSPFECKKCPALGDRGGKAGEEVPG